MALHNFKQYKLTIGSRNDAVRVVKQLLHSKPDNPYKSDGTNEYTSQLASAVSELQRRHRLPVTGNIGQAEYWALGQNVLDVRLKQLTCNDRTLNNLLHGGILGNAFAESSSFAEGGQNIDTIKIDGEHYVDWNFDDGRSVRKYVLPDTKILLNANSGVLATNVYRAIAGVSALIEFPTKSTKVGLVGSVTLEGSITLDPKSKSPGGSGGGALQGGMSYEAEYDSADSILRELRMANQAVRVNLLRAISSHNFAVANADPKIADVMKPLGEIPANDADNMAVSFANRAAETANKIAREMYRKENSNKGIPSQFSEVLTGDKIF